MAGFTISPHFKENVRSSVKILHEFLLLEIGIFTHALSEVHNGIIGLTASSVIRNGFSSLKSSYYVEVECFSVEYLTRINGLIFIKLDVKLYVCD